MKKDTPLTNLQQTVLDLFFEKTIGKKYFLTGGTALAGFYFKHRRSIDLDLFTFEDIEVNSIKAVLTDIAKQTNTKLDHRVATVNFHLFFLIGKGKELKIDFVREQPVHFGQIKNFGRIRVDSIENIGSNKMTAILGRTEAKDFIDLYFIIQRKIFTFDKLLQDAKKKDLGLSEFYFAHMLLEVNNLKDFPKILVPFNKEGMIEYFVNQANKLLLNAKPA
ncbi:nucleotidyl transferase AbiEii/AbiGii toxin family protein [Candidatus Daviesbacteria bacterium]|nr:nucleotidyl transferase AbiEii/AbiGii toxin family protein [Candidatus Daviesbacteria bacterium]